MTGFVDEMFQKLCAGCIADFNGGFPDFCVEELKKRWAAEGHCLRCNAILDPQSVPEYRDQVKYLKERTSDVEALIADNKALLEKYPDRLSLKFSLRSWEQHREELIKEKADLEEHWRKKPLSPDKHG